MSTTTRTLPPTPIDLVAPPRASRWTVIRRVGWLVIALVAVLGMPWFIYPPVAMDIAAWALFAMSIDLLLGFGGMGTLWGGPIGAAIIVLLEDYLASAGFGGIGIITGAIFIICVLAFRKGVVGTSYAIAEKIRTGGAARRRPDPGPFDTVDSVTATGNVHDDEGAEAPR